MDAAIRDAGAESHLLKLNARDDTQEAGFLALFDRTALYAEFTQSLKDARTAFKSATEVEVRKALRSLDQQLQSVLDADFFPGKAADVAKSGLQALRHEAERQLSPGEPATATGEVTRLSTDDYQGQTWATRARPWVDRLATAWLVQRFVDKRPTFLWLANAKKCPKSALGYDFDGATFTHVGERVTFEVVASSFALDIDAGVKRLGELVHFIDIGGVPVDEAAGLELLIRGLQAQHHDDDALFAASIPLFDALYAALQTTK
ncbi:MAG: chromate resistance protein ChrB domain-containing protein [Pseudomonadota bacterium]